MSQLTPFAKTLTIAAAGAFVLGVAGSALAQADRAFDRAAAPSAVAQGTANGTAATLKRQTPDGDLTGRRAVTRNGAVTTGSAAAAPIALALQDGGPAPASTPEPLTVVLVGGALAGLYGMRRHLE